MISDNFLLGVIRARVSFVFQQRIRVKDSHIPYAPSHTVPIYSSVRPSVHYPVYRIICV